MICVYDKDTIDFNNNGKAVLNNCLSAFIDETKNGPYELEIEYPLLSVDKKIQYLIKKNIIKADGQLFRIYHTDKDTKAKIIRINARHIFYDAADDFLEDTRAENATCEAALIKAFSQLPKFTVHSDITTTDNAYFVEESPIEGVFGKILPRWGGELLRDNFNVSILANRGMNRGEALKVGKNIDGVRETIDTTSMITRIYPKGYNGVTLTEKYLVSPNYDDYPITKKVEFPEATTEDELRTVAQAYLDKVDKPEVNIKVDMIDVSQTVEYKNYKVLETVYLCDWLNFDFKKYNIENSEIQVIRLRKDLLRKINVSIELGQPKRNLSGSLNTIEYNASYSRTLLDNMLDDNKRLNPSFMAAMISLATTSIVSNDGHVLLKNNAILIMDTTDEMTAQKVWRWSVGGLGYSSTGVNGPYKTAITADGKIVADFIITGHIKGGYLDINLDAGTILIGQSTANYILYFDGTNLNLKNASVKGYKKDASNNDILRYSFGADGSFYVGNTVASINLGTDGKFSLLGPGYELSDSRFALGDISKGDGAEHRKDYSKWMHGTDYTQANSSGFKRYNGATGRDYHYLNYIGTADASSGGITIQLPDEFKGKDFKVALSVRAYNTPSSDKWITGINLWVDSYDTANARFVVKGYASYGYTSSWSYNSTNGYLVDYSGKPTGSPQYYLYNGFSPSYSATTDTIKFDYIAIA